jgi:hypothetical protein
MLLILSLLLALEGRASSYDPSAAAAAGHQTPQKKKRRSSSFQTPLERSKQDKLQKLDDKGIAVIQEPPSLVRYVRFPGVPNNKMVSQEAYDQEYHDTVTGSPYGNPKLFSNVLGTIPGELNTFSDAQRALLVVYNLIKNKGTFASDYHEKSDRKVDKILTEANLKENHWKLKIPLDLRTNSPRIFAAMFYKITAEQRQALEEEFGYEKNQLSADLIDSWIIENVHDEAGRADANLDHIIPKAGLGSNDLRNAAFISKECNLAKSDLKIASLIEYFSTVRKNHCPSVRHGDKIINLGIQLEEIAALISTRPRFLSHLKVS